MSTTTGQRLAGRLSRFRKRNNAGVVFNGATYYPGTLALSEEADPGQTPDGNRNAANSGPRAFDFSPVDFVGVPLPAENNTFVWLSTGQTYVVDRAEPSPLGSTWRCITHMAPTPGTSPDDEAQDAMFAYTIPGN